jgi:hypothetical protein
VLSISDLATDPNLQEAVQAVLSERFLNIAKAQGEHGTKLVLIADTARWDVVALERELVHRVSLRPISSLGQSS